MRALHKPRHPQQTPAGYAWAGRCAAPTLMGGRARLLPRRSPAIFAPQIAANGQINYTLDFTVVGSGASIATNFINSTAFTFFASNLTAGGDILSSLSPTLDPATLLDGTNYRLSVAARAGHHRFVGARSAGCCHFAAAARGRISQLGDGAISPLSELPGDRAEPVEGAAACAGRAPVPPSDSRDAGGRCAPCAS